MSKFNTPVSMKTRATSPIRSATPTATHQGSAGYSRDAKSELFLLAVSNMVGESTFYEAGGSRDTRFEELVHTVALDDPDWLGRFIPWLRGEANMRSASLVAAAEAVKARLAAGEHGGNRQMVDAACQRADEPGEMLAYWTSRHGRALPKPVKRGVADAVRRLYNGKSLLKYDTDSKGFRFGDVIDLVHPTPAADKPWQGELFRHALDRRHGRDGASLPEGNRTLAAREALMALPVAERRAVLLADGGAERLAAAGMTWEALAGWLQGPMDAAAWECLAEGTPIWLPDGTVAPIERVVAGSLPVLAYDQEWDLRDPRMGRPYPPRSQEVGALVPTVPVRWIDNGEQPVFAVQLVSGRVIEATSNHRWAVRSRDGARRATWQTTADLTPGSAVPAPLTAGFFGSLGDEWDGWFVGTMLGDGNMTGRTPTWVGHDDGTLEQLRMYASKHGCEANVDDHTAWVLVRLVDPAWHQNALRDLLIEHQVWGLKGENKRVANLPYSRAFTCGLIAGLFDSDGSIGKRQAEFANISETLVRQLADALLRLGIQSAMTSRKNNRSEKPLWVLRVSDGRSLVRLAEAVQLRSSHKAAALDALAAQGRASRRTGVGSRGYSDAIMWDRVVSVEAAGVKKTYCVEVQPSHLWVANGVVTGNCIIPSMGYMALLRNLRNFDQAGVSDEIAEQVCARLADPEQVAKSRQFPFRFYAAHKNTGSLRWGAALEKALKASLANVPVLSGRTLVLVDQSPSMFPGYYFSTPNRSDIPLAEKAALFGTAVALRAEHADLVGYGMTHYRVPFSKGDAVLEVMKRFHMNDGTDTPRAMVENFAGHDRVLIVTDEQTAQSQLFGRTVDNAVPAHVPVYTWNLSGLKYGHGQSGSGRRHTFGGLSDSCFRMVPLLEAGQSQAWPWEKASA